MFFILFNAVITIRKGRHHFEFFLCLETVRLGVFFWTTASDGNFFFSIYVLFAKEYC